MEAIFTDNEEELKRLSLNINKKEIKARLRESIISNSAKIYDQLLRSRNVETQIAILNIILKTMTKEDIRSSNVLNAHNRSILSIQKNNKNSLLGFLKEFSLVEPECRVIGVEVDVFKIRDREINGGFLFMGDENFRFQKDNEVVIIQFKSIENVLFNGIDFTVLATEGRRVEIKFMYRQDLGRFKERVMCKFTQVDAEESIVVEIGKKVTFSPEIKVKERSYRLESADGESCDNKEGESHTDNKLNIIPSGQENEIPAVDNLKERLDDYSKDLNVSKSSLGAKRQSRSNKTSPKSNKKPISPISKVKLKCNDSKVKHENDLKQSPKSKGKTKTKKKLKVFKKAQAKSECKKKKPSFEKERCFNGFKNEVYGIYKDKLKLARLIYKSMKEDAVKFKNDAESIGKYNVYRIK